MTEKTSLNIQMVFIITVFLALLVGAIAMSVEEANDRANYGKPPIENVE